MKTPINQMFKRTLVTISVATSSLMMSAPLWAMGQQPAGADGQSQGSTASLFLPMILVFVIFYFLLIRPQSKQQKKLKTMISSLKRDDEVVTNGGVHGVVTGLTENVLTLEIANNVRIKVERSAISQVKSPGEKS
jgi:preprotein translocase subunit YajC